MARSYRDATSVRLGCVVEHRGRQAHARRIPALSRAGATVPSRGWCTNGDCIWSRICPERDILRHRPRNLSSLGLVESPYRVSTHHKCPTL